MDKQFMLKYIPQILYDIRLAKETYLRVMWYVDKEWGPYFNRMVIVEMKQDEAIIFAKKKIAAIIIDQTGIIFQKTTREMRHALKEPRNEI
jgi:hypothetical protein